MCTTNEDLLRLENEIGEIEEGKGIINGYREKILGFYKKILENTAGNKDLMEGYKGLMKESEMLKGIYEGKPLLEAYLEDVGRTPEGQLLRELGDYIRANGK